MDQIKPQQTSPFTHKVIDGHTGAIMGYYRTLRAAHARADKLDLAYGAVRYGVQRVI